MTSKSRIHILRISMEFSPYAIGGLGTHVHQLTRGLNHFLYEFYVAAYASEIAVAKFMG